MKAKNNMTHDPFNDFTKAIFKATLREAFAIQPIANTFLALVMVWGSYAILTSGLFVPKSEVPTWITSSAVLWIMGSISLLAILMASMKSLIPAVALWAVGIALIFLNSSLVIGFFMLAIVSGMLFRMFGSR